MSAIRVEPGGVLTAPDPVLGFTYLPGRFKVTFDDGDSWVLTHRLDSLRIARPVDADDAFRGRPGVWIFGCSFVHGWGLNDTETLPWKVQARLPGFDVTNFGVGGYGTVQSLLQFRRSRSRKPSPRIAIIAYAGFHDERNILSRRWRKGGYEYAHLGTTATPCVCLEGDGLRFDFDLALAFAREATDAGARPVVAGISREGETEQMLRFARDHGIASVDISVDLTQRANRIRWDGHPSAVANDKSAERLTAFLATLGADGTR